MAARRRGDASGAGHAAASASRSPRRVVAPPARGTAPPRRRRAGAVARPAWPGRRRRSAATAARAPPRPRAPPPPPRAPARVERALDGLSATTASARARQHARDDARADAALERARHDLRGRRRRAHARRAAARGRARTRAARPRGSRGAAGTGECPRWPWRQGRRRSACRRDAKSASVRGPTQTLAVAPAGSRAAGAAAPRRALGGRRFLRCRLRRLLRARRPAGLLADRLDGPMFTRRPLDAHEVPAAAVRRARVGAVAPRDGRRDGRLPALGQVGHRAAPGALHGDAVRAVDDRRRAAPARADGAQGVEGAVRRRARGLRVALLLRLGELLRALGPPRGRALARRGSAARARLVLALRGLAPRHGGPVAGAFRPPRG